MWVSNKSPYELPGYEYWKIAYNKAIKIADLSSQLGVMFVITFKISI